MIYRLEHWAVPPSINHGNQRGQHWSKARRQKQEWEGTFAYLLVKFKVPRDLLHVHVDAELQFKDRRRRDADNFYAAISKPLADAMVKGGWLHDDGPEHYEMDLRLKKGEPETKLVLTLITTEAMDAAL